MNIKIKEMIERFLKKDIIKIEKVKYGGANLVYNIITSDKKEYILKLYMMKRNFCIINELNNYLKENGIKTLKIIKNWKINNVYYYLYERNIGIHKLNFNKKMINSILEVIRLEYENKNIHINIKDSIIEKFLIYKDYFLSKDVNRIPKNIIENINKITKKIDLNIIDLCLIHGDLSITNILWDQNNDMSIIDFDESIYAPIEYELSSFIIKICFFNSIFNKDLAKIIMKEIKIKFKNIDYYKFRNSWILYISKVIYEKLYFYELGYIDIESKEHKKDYWKWWYKLLIDQEIFDEIYFDEYKLFMIENNKFVIKNDEKSIVQIVSLGVSKFILKKNKYNFEENVYNEKLILDSLSFSLNVPRIVKIEEKDGYIYRLYTYKRGKHRLKYSNEEEKILIKEFSKLVLELNSINVNAQIGNLENKIKDLINTTKNSFYKLCLKKLLLDNEFKKKVNSEEKQIVHDDLHRYNILFNKNEVVFLDFEGLKKYPKSLQIASFITTSYIYEGEIEKIDYLLSKLKVEKNRRYIINLIIYRVLKTLIFFEKKLEINFDNNTKLKQERLYNSFIEILNKKEGIIVELRDYYNANKEPIGETYPSNIEPTGDKYMLIVVIFIQNSKGEYLIQKATKRKGGKWGTTSGHPVAGENSIKGMNREIREELGIDIPIEKYKFVNTFIGHNKIVDLYYLMEDIDILKLSLQPEEVEKVKWVTKEEIDTLIKDNDFEKTHTKLFADLQKWMNND